MIRLAGRAAGWARADPRRVAVVGDDGRVTYQELVEQAASLADVWRARVAPARLAYRAADPVGTAVAAVAADLAGVSLLLLDTAASDAEHRRALAAFHAGAMLDRYGHPTADRSRHVDAAADDGAGPPGLGLSTSGVDGPAKCVRRPWPSVADNANGFATALGVASHDVLLCTTPPHHSYAFCAGIVTALVSGATYVGVARHASPRSVAATIDRERVTVLMSVPLLYRWYATGLHCQRPPRLCVSAGSALPEPDRAAWAARVGWPLVEHYGSSELGMLTVDPQGPAGSVGRPIDGVRISVPDADPAGVGVVYAEIGGAPPQLLHPDQEPVPLTGRVPTGDLGRLDTDGWLHLVGRVDGLINLAGNKVSAAEVESAIRGYGTIRDCAVVADTSGSGAARLCAFIESSARLDRAGLVAYLRQRLAPYKIPTVVVVVDRLPRSPAGKILRSRLLAEVAER